jgi:circadian clock protein KaiB
VTSHPLHAPPPTPTLLKLYVAGRKSDSLLAIERVTGLCASQLAGRCQLEVVDVLLEPQRGSDAAVLVTPTLVRESPGPERRAVGNLSDVELVLAALGIEAVLA